jgi:pyrroline-5-carboxylate reductase
MSEGNTIGFIGGGNMGEALIRGLITASVLRPEQLYVHDVIASRLDYLKTNYSVHGASTIAEVAGHCEVLILAVKPQVMPRVMEELRTHMGHRPLIISIAAGISLETLCLSLPPGTPVIRVMPNTPALVLQGVSALSRGPGVTSEHMDRAMTLFRAVGSALEVEEKWMDAVTGLSGSGPAYFLLLIEGLIDAGVLMGLPRPVARELVVQTALGSAGMVLETGKHPAELKDMITSPGGTTISGLKVLEEAGVRGSLMRAVEAATLRSQELGKR